MMETLHEVLPWIIVTICIISEAFFAGSELAILSSNRINLEALAEQGDRSAERVLWFRGNPDQLFGTTLLGTNISTVTGSTIASLTLLSKDPAHGEWWAMLIMSPLVLMGGEIIPKSLAQAHAIYYARFLSGPLKFFNRLFKPAIFLVSQYTRLLSRRFNLPKGDEGVTREELVFLVREEESTIEDDERELISRIFAFKQLSAKEVMIPLAELKALSQDATAREGAAFILEYGYSRIPIYEERVDHIVGVVHHIDLLKTISPELPLKSLMQDVIYAAELQEVDELLAEVQQASASVVIVVDEFGSAEGLITLEDLIEEIVGEIDDEFDEQERLWTQGPNQLYYIEARAPIEVVNQRFSLALPEAEDYDTIAGYVLNTLRRIPEVGDVVDAPSGVQIRVTQANERAIKELSIRFHQRPTTPMTAITSAPTGS
jgi:putative hemolysin